MAQVDYNYTSWLRSQLNNVFIAGDQFGSTVARVGERFIGAWSDTTGGDGSVQARIIDPANPNSTNQFTANSIQPNTQGDPDLAAWTNNRALLVYTDLSVDPTGDIQGRIIDANGVATSFTVIADSSSDTDASITALSDGGFAVTWMRNYHGGSPGTYDDLDIRLQTFNANGTPRGSLTSVESAIDLASRESSVAGLAGASGNLVVVWRESARAVGSPDAIYFTDTVRQAFRSVPRPPWATLAHRLMILRSWRSPTEASPSPGRTAGWARATWTSI